MLLGVGVFETEVKWKASEVRANHEKRTLLGRRMDFCGTEMTSSVWDGQLPSHWTPTGCP